MFLKLTLEAGDHALRPGIRDPYSNAASFAMLQASSGVSKKPRREREGGPALLILST